MESTRRSFTSEEDRYNEFKVNFCTVAFVQGRVAYLFMSIYAVNPYIWHKIFNVKPGGILLANMLYGTGVFIYSRPSLSPIATFNRVVFSILGSMMFNYSSMAVYRFLTEQFDIDRRPFLLTFLGFLSGRLMILHLLAFIYHMDTRSVVGRPAHRDIAFEQMYL